MSKRITQSQLLGEIGESATRTRFLSLGFQFDVRSRLEAGIDAIAEIMSNGQPLAKMIAVQVKCTEARKYAAEDDRGFTYLLNSEDLEYWQNSNLPVIIVLYRQSDNTFYWKDVRTEVGSQPRKLQFDKNFDVLDQSSADKIAALTVPINGHGYYVPPLGGGEEALVNMLPITMPAEMFVSSTPFSGRKATSVLLNSDDSPRFDWIIKGDTFWSFHDPRKSSTLEIVDADQVEVIDTSLLAFHEDLDEQNSFSFLLRTTLQHQVREDLNWNKYRKLFYFRAIEANQSRKFSYLSSKKRATTTVVNVTEKKKEPGSVAFVRHHAFIPRFERLLDQWHLIVSPTYHFTTNGFIPHTYPDALLSGKKRLDNNAALRGQVIMWHRFLAGEQSEIDLLTEIIGTPACLTFGTPPIVTLPTSVPEDAWGNPKKTRVVAVEQSELELDRI